jgi:hypothetical protein
MKNNPRRCQRASTPLHAEVQVLEDRCLLTALLYQDDLSYLGAFRVPHGDIGASTFAYGGTAPAYNPTNHSLFLVGHDHDQAVAEISIPQIVNSANINDLATASVLQPFQNIESRVQMHSLNSESKIGGLQVVDDHLVGTFFEYYDADLSAVHSHFELSTLDLSSSASGLFQVGNEGGGFVGGYMAAVPPEWQDDLGAPYITGQAALSIIERTSAGPAAFAFDPADLGGTTAPATPLVNYPLEHPLRPVSSTNPWFNLTTEITGVLFAPNTRSVLFFGSHGTGEYCYGTAAECNDPVRVYHGTHSRGGLYEYQVWAYDVLDLIAVKNGQLQSWEIQPYDVWTFDLPFPEPQQTHRGRHVRCSHRSLVRLSTTRRSARIRSIPDHPRLRNLDKHRAGHRPAGYQQRAVERRIEWSHRHLDHE